MLNYTIDDPIDDPLTHSVEVTIDFNGEKGWLFFATPQLLSTVGDKLPGTQVRFHLGERHMMVVSELTTEVIDSVLVQLNDAGELKDRTIPLMSSPF